MVQPKKGTINADRTKNPIFSWEAGSPTKVKTPIKHHRLIPTP